MSDFVIEHNHPDLGKLRIFFSVTKGGICQISRIIDGKANGWQAWLDVRHDIYTTRKSGWTMTPVPDGVTEFANSAECSQLLSAELRVLSKRFDKAADRLIVEQILAFDKAGDRLMGVFVEANRIEETP